MEKLKEDLNKTLSEYRNISGNHINRALAIVNSQDIIGSISKLMLAGHVQPGFKALRDAGKLDSTFEAVVVRNAHLFSDEVVKSAKWRLDNANVMPD